MRRTYNLVELFSGIGSQAKALKNLNVKVNTLGTCEWDIHAFMAYDAIHNAVVIPKDIDSMTKDEILVELKKYTLSSDGKKEMPFKSLSSYSLDALKRVYTGIIRSKNFVDINSLEGTMLADDIDILTYSFPCQDLSNVGAFHGYNKGIDKNSGSRSSLLWQVGRILSEMRDNNKKMPRFLLMENVPTLLAKRHINNFNMWIDDLKELGYTSKYFQLNASLFGQPQNRPRLLMLSVYTGDNEIIEQTVSKFFNGRTEADVVNDYRKSKYFHDVQLKDLLRIDYSQEKLFDEAVECTPNDTVSRRRIWDNNPQIIFSNNELNEDMTCVRTITTKQDRDPNSGNLYFDSGIEGRSKFRYLTPRECLLFMGFTDEDYERIKKYDVEFHKNSHIFPRDKIIRMAGNSIPVKLLEGIFWQVILLDGKITKALKNKDKSSL